LELTRKRFFAINLVISLFLIISFLPVNAITIFTVPQNDDDHIHFVAFESSPREQFANNVALESIKCSDGLQLIMKKSTGMPACVKSSTYSVLIERGWGIHVLPNYTEEDNNSEIFPTGDYQVKTESVSYFQNANGYLAQPDVEGEYPGIIMVHEFWGLNDNIKDMAEKLASHGYIVFAVDLYDGQVAATSDEARQLMGSFDQQQYTDNMNTAVAYLEENYNPQMIGSIGWCFGGGQSLQLALNNENMDATVIYYGQLVTDKEELSKISWPVLGIFAALDQGIPPEKVNEFKAALDELQIQNEIHIYPDVNHAFANPSGDRYAPEAAKDAWQKTLEFFDSNL
jgi:carboxymethylenebutenolidase